MFYLHTTYGIEIECLVPKDTIFDAMSAEGYNAISKKAFSSQQMRQFGISSDDLVEKIFNSEQVMNFCEEKLEKFTTNGQIENSLQESEYGQHFETWCDNSISKGPGHVPIEFVSPIIDNSNFRNVVDAIQFLEDDFKIRSDASCGLHVHVGMNAMLGESQDDHLLFMQNFSAAYLLAEDRLDEQLRGSNRYAKSLGEDSSKRELDSIDDMYGKIAGCKTITALCDTLQPDRLSDEDGSNKYYKVNLESYNRIGTIEIRQHQGFESTQETLSWLNYVNELVEVALTQTKGGHLADLDTLEAIIQQKGLETIRPIELQAESGNIPEKVVGQADGRGQEYSKIHELNSIATELRNVILSSTKQEPAREPTLEELQKTFQKGKEKSGQRRESTLYR